MGMQNLSEQIIRNNFLIKELQNNLDLLRFKDFKISKLEDKIKNLEEVSFDLISKTTQNSDERLGEELNYYLHPSKLEKEPQLKDQAIKRRDTKILNLEKQNCKLTEHLEHKIEEQDILIQKLDEQMKKNKKMLLELNNHSLHLSKFETELQLKDQIIKKRDSNMQNLAKKILKLTELVRSLEFDLEHREEEQDALLQKLDEQMKKNKNITM